MLDDEHSRMPDALTEPGSPRDQGLTGFHADSSSANAEGHPSPVAGEPSAAEEAASKLVAGEAVAVEGKADEQEVGNQDEEEEDDDAVDYEACQEDEETRSYMPLSMEQMLEDPPLPPDVDKSDFQAIFHSYAEDYRPPHRPKRDIEFQWVWQAAMAQMNLFRFDKMSAAIVANERRAAVEALHKKAAAVVPSSKEEAKKLDWSAKEAAMEYFLDPDYEKKFQKTLKIAGFTANAVTSEAFLRALPPLKEIERLKKSAKKERDEALKQLDLAYDMRSADQQMPLSSAANRRFYLEVQRDKQLAREEELERAQKAAEDGNPQADRGE